MKFELIEKLCKCTFQTPAFVELTTTTGRNNSNAQFCKNKIYGYTYFYMGIIKIYKWVSLHSNRTE